MATVYPDVVPIIESWLSANHQKIESFWVGADWRYWARYELFMALEKLIPDCLVTHGMSEFWDEGDEEVDILVEPRDGDRGTIALLLRCENVGENEGSYERFRDQLDADVAKVESLGRVGSSFDDARLLLVGFSGEPSAEDAEFRTQPQPEHFVKGEVHCWMVRHDVLSRDQDDSRGTKLGIIVPRHGNP
ncbi:hypothetical protein BKA67DRAFT_657597 [Truncatella angustata]|uniref:Uncharacterized protein n=1 Tax=Truncatella angustata TaxID=152316 RepID=A0A9P9A052_9PEZI|nr:uncharacterized protein BKA67DRAFT_657597 [Truncatella angustata]KAH6655674.1 hypothetical protein BKA67DRAFT_657597 [Truncatella angustata]KAH8201933.1 hypothetical protein TruAng_003925 [Truncatella angustata]